MLSDIPYNEFDYQSLMDALSTYKHPRDKVTQLLLKGYLIRVKKGIYVFGADAHRGSYCMEVLANKIYGPSYLSLDYALAYHNLIPEAVHEMTSVTTSRNKVYQTPVGVFSYRKLPLKLYALDVGAMHLSDSRVFLMASKEQAVLDKLYLAERLASPSELSVLVYDDWRINPSDLDVSRLHTLANLSGIPYLIHITKGLSG